MARDAAWVDVGMDDDSDEELLPEDRAIVPDAESWTFHRAPAAEIMSFAPRWFYLEYFLGAVGVVLLFLTFDPAELLF